MGSRYLWKPVRTLQQACRGSSSQGRNCLFCDLADRCLPDVQDGAGTAAGSQPLLQGATRDGCGRSRISSPGLPEPELPG